MPSPIAHSMMGYVLYRLAKPGDSRRRRRWAERLPAALAIVLVFSLLPDVDAVFGLLAGDFGRYHNNGTHSLAVGLALALGTAALIQWRWRSGFWRWFLVLLLSYEMHVILDFFTRGRGVMLLWPLSEQRFSSPLILFYGVRWSEGLFSALHLWTLVNELAFVLAAGLALRWLNRSRLSRSQKTSAPIDLPNLETLRSLRPDKSADPSKTYEDR